jgi:hypothetical protein
MQYMATPFEFTLVQFMTEKNKWLKILILIGRLIFNWRKLCGSISAHQSVGAILNK